MARIPNFAPRPPSLGEEAGSPRSPPPALLSRPRLRLRRCSTRSSTKPCWSTTSTGTPSWTCPPWRDTCRRCRAAPPASTASAWRRSSGSVPRARERSGRPFLRGVTRGGGRCLAGAREGGTARGSQGTWPPAGVCRLRAVSRAPGRCGLWRPCQEAGACSGAAALHRPPLSSWPQKLTNVRIMKENMRTGNLPANMKKARVIQIIPCKAAGRGGGAAPEASVPGNSLTHLRKAGSRSGPPWALPLGALSVPGRERPPVKPRVAQTVPCASDRRAAGGRDWEVRDGQMHCPRHGPGASGFPTPSCLPRPGQRLGAPFTRGGGPDLACSRTRRTRAEPLQDSLGGRAGTGLAGVLGEGRPRGLAGPRSGGARVPWAGLGLWGTCSVGREGKANPRDAGQGMGSTW